MKALLSICLVLGLALSVNSVRVKTHAKSHSTISQSWQDYVDEQLVGTGHVSGAALIGLDGNVWASNNLNIRSGEGAKIVNLFRNPANVFAAGITVDNVKYLGIKGDDRSIYGKKAATGVICVKTGQAVLVGVYNDKMQPGNAALVIERLADYLIESGY